MKGDKYRMFTSERVSMLLLALSIGLLLIFVTMNKRTAAEIPPVPQSLIDSIRSRQTDSISHASDSVGTASKKQGRTGGKSGKANKPRKAQRSHLDEPVDNHRGQ